MKKYFTPQELAERWNVSLSSVYSRSSNKQDMPPSVRIGKVRRFDIAAVEKWEAEHAC